MFPEHKISPFTYGIPFVVMLIVVGVAMFAAGSGTDLRSHASTSTEKQCAAACTKLGGSTAACLNVCPKVLSGDMSCETASGILGTRSSKLFLSACERIAPRNRTCEQVCGNINMGSSEGAGVAKNVCKTVCGDVSTGAKTCDQACSGVLSSVPRGDSYLGACKTMCAKIPVKSSPSPTVSPKPETGFDPATCASKCKPPKMLSGETATSYSSRCMSICADMSTGTKSCQTGCSGLGSYWGNECRQKFCTK